MSRRAAAPARTILPDPKFNSDMLAKFMNVVMQDGKKSAAEHILYGAIERITEKTGKQGAEAIELLSTSRRQTLAMRWVIEAARARTEKSMAFRIAHELMDAAENRGGAVRKREDTHRMADANRAFAHYRW